MKPRPASVDGWLEALFARHLRELTHPEVSRALKALTRDYVQRRGRIRGDAFAGRGKRAAFCLYYGPRHFVMVREVLRALKPGPCKAEIVDLGCGTGVASAAWALEHPGLVVGVDTADWALAEARQSWRELGVRGGALRCTLDRFRWPPPPRRIVAAFALNELAPALRARLLQRMLDHAAAGGQALVVEPLATRITPWWSAAALSVQEAGGRVNEWHLSAALPQPVALLGKSAGLNPRELGARTLWLDGTSGGIAPVRLPVEEE
ncbi:MAG: methyltransferase domain-containing protein [Planctomycetes bacterium]|nr:methyltransferase domain-containing protein [Planctomycetota bacterium]